MNTFNIRQVKPAEALTLLHISKKTFLDTFAHLNSEDDISIYSDKFFTPEQILSELSNPGSVFYFIENEHTIAGYLKLNYAAAQTELKEMQAVEVERIYVLAEHQGKQIGQQLLTFAIDTAHAQQLKYVWLGVWENNINAIRFYERNGFKPVGRHSFMLGNDKQTDILMRKEL